MSLWMRIALTWLLALALPLQGHAAQSMGLCGPGHPQPVSAARHIHPSAGLHGPADAGMDVQAHALMHGQMHEQMHAQTPAGNPHATPADADAGAPADPGPLGADGTCSVCAACCSAHALTSPVPVFEVSTEPARYITESSPSRFDKFPGGLDRPPRAPLA